MTETSFAELPIGGITAAQGFRAAGVAAGLSSTSKLDVALVVNDGPSASAAGVFTTNRIKASPVLWSQQVLATGQLRAVVLNSGGANAGTGPGGFQDTHATAERAAAGLGLGAVDIAVCSTGIIGERLPMDSLLSGVDSAISQLSEHGGDDAALAILTTDSVPKQAVFRNPEWTVGGMAKGAGMLAPSLATMLAVITTDAVADPQLLNEVLTDAVRGTFECLDSDGCLSTNDTVLLLANGSSGVMPPREDFSAAVTSVCQDLMAQLLADAEGSTKDIEIEVRHAFSYDDALEVGRSIARNNLVKCALYGGDPNWGRILAAVGVTSAHFDPDNIDISLNDVWICKDSSKNADPKEIDLTDRLIRIVVDLHSGNSTARIWTNDLSVNYVHTNSAYST